MPAARRRAGSTARCWRRTASPASSTCSRRLTAASARRSRARTDRFKLEELSAGFGERFETMGIALKFYSCVGSNHTTLDSIRDIQKRRPFTLAELDKIVVHGSQVTVDHVGWPYKPEGLTSAQLNLPYCVATLLLEGDCFVDQFTEAMVADPAAHGAVAQGRGRRRPRDHRARLEIPAHDARRRAPAKTARSRARRARRRAAASNPSPPATRSSTNSAS